MRDKTSLVVLGPLSINLLKSQLLIKS